MRVRDRSTVLWLVVLLAAGAGGQASAGVNWKNYLEDEDSKPPPVRAASDSGPASEDWSSSAPLSPDQRPAEVTARGKAKRGKAAKRARAAKRSKGKGKAKHRAARRTRERDR